MPRLKDTYKSEIVPALMQKFGYANIMQAPKLEKVVINMGMGDIKDNPKALDSALEELQLISGQKPVVTLAKHSVANFKLRAGMKIGAKSRCAATACMSLWISSSASRFPASETSAVFRPRASMAEATMRWA